MIFIYIFIAYRPINPNPYSWVIKLFKFMRFFYLGENVPVFVWFVEREKVTKQMFFFEFSHTTLYRHRPHKADLYTPRGTYYNGMEDLVNPIYSDNPLDSSTLTMLGFELCVGNIGL